MLLFMLPSGRALFRRLPLARAFLSATALVLLAVALIRLAPLESPQARTAPPGLVVVDAAGAVIAGEDRAGLHLQVALDAIAPRMVQATVSAEDRRFGLHPGVDPLAMARALLHLSDQPSGASTITQQVARLLYLAADREPLLVRKTREAVHALQLEAHYSKQEILALYLNNVYYGRGAYGVEAAARTYFGLTAAQLDVAHAAYLAGLPQRPSASDAFANDRWVRERQAYVLTRMREDGWISHAEAQVAARELIVFAVPAPAASADAFAAYARAELARVRPDLTSRDGLVIETTLDGGLQAEAERLMRLRLGPLADRNVTDGALVAIEPETGRILAMVGSVTDGEAGHGGAINMAITPRQPGSALKPLLYAAAFEHGFTAATPLLDVPTTFTTNEGPYAPLDFDRAFRGVVPLRVALASSLNVPAVRTLDALGLDAMLEMTRRFGLGTLSDAESYGLSLALGGGDVRLLDLTAAYAALGAGGELRTPFAVTRVRDAAGAILYVRAPGPARRVLSSAHAYLLADILSDPDARIPGFGAVTPFDVPFPAAVKSGTSTGPRDNWTLGFTPEIAIGVWVGNADGSSMSDVSGVDGAGPIWRDAMMAAALGRRMTWYARPTEITEATVCAPTGMLPGPDCPSPVRELFVAGTQPTAPEDYYGRATDGTLTVDPPTEARAWAVDAGLTLRSDARGAPDPLRVVTPPPGSVLWLAPELGTQETMLRAVAAPGIAHVTFVMDGAVIGDAPAADLRLLWALVPGRHVLVLSAPGVAPVSSAFEVRP